MEKMIQQFQDLIASKKLLPHIDDNLHRLYLEVLGFSQFAQIAGGQISFTEDEIEFLEAFKMRLMWRIFGGDIYTIDNLLDELN